jgi:hypothetical protein
MVGPVPACGRELLRGWRWPIGLTASFTIFTASVSKILDATLYKESQICQMSGRLHSVCGLSWEQIPCIEHKF